MGKSTESFLSFTIKEGPQFIFSSVILIDSVFRTGKNYYPRKLNVKYVCFLYLKHVEWF